MDWQEKVWQKPDYFVAFGFGLGTLPIAPGTWGTLAGIPLFFMMNGLSWWAYLLLTALFFAFGVWLCDRVSEDIGVHDHSGIVWDEVVGLLVTLFLVPPTVFNVSMAFVLFRVFDIVKPPPIGFIDKQVKGGLGIMLDDILAGVYAWLVLALIIYLRG